MSDEISGRLAALVKHGRELVDDLMSEPDDAWIDDAAVDRYETWLHSSGNLFLAIGGVEEDPFREFRRIVTSQRHPAGLKTYVVRKAFDLLLNVLEQQSRGKLRRIEDIVVATNCDDFLDLAEEYRQANRQSESTTLSSAVLTFALRRIAARAGVTPDARTLDRLVAALVEAGLIEPERGRAISRFAEGQDPAAPPRPDRLPDAEALIQLTRQVVTDYL